VSRRMYRFAVPVDDQAHIIPLSHNPVAVAAREYGAYQFAVEFWAEHTEDAHPVRRAFQVFGTGHPLPEDAKWTGTCPRMPSGLVWHLYEVPVDPAVESADMESQA
jgi:hypothetical protein